jgi:ADP-heptose:LPS heptosyltransferase
MNISRMRHIDYVMGGMICLLLDVFERAKRMFPSKSPRREPRTVVVTKYLGMGSILLATSAVSALKKAYPSCRVILLTFASNAAFAKRIPLFDEVLSIRTTTLPVFAMDTLINLMAVRRMKADYLLDFEFFARFSTIVSYLSGAACRVGYYMPQIWRGDLLDIPVHFNPYRHVCEIFSAQVEAIGITTSGSEPAAPTVDDAALERVREMLLREGVHSDETLVSVNVNASELSLERRWPKDRFVALLDALARRPGIRFVLLGSPDEHPYVDSVYNDLQPSTRQSCINLAGKQSLDEFIALLSLSHACISNDSGPLHIAAILGVPTVSFYGPESPLLYGPHGSGHTVFYAGIYCSPCLSVYNAKQAMCSGNNLCMQAITPEQVLYELLHSDKPSLFSRS